MEVELDALVVMKVVRHCHSALPSFVTGQLLGLDIERALEITHSFPFPNKDQRSPQLNDDDNPDQAGESYQAEMMRCLRDVNVDNNTVGWYKSTYFSSFIDEDCIETQFNYQLNIPTAVLLIYDPSRTHTMDLPLQAFRLTDNFMELYEKGDFSTNALQSASFRSSDIFEELPVRTRTSSLSAVLLHELSNQTSPTPDYSRLELNTDTFLEKQLQLLIESVDDMQQESMKLQHFERNLQKQKVAQQQYLAQKQIEATAKQSRGEKVPEENHANNPLFRPLPQPSRLESLMVASQMDAYCEQITKFSNQGFVKNMLLNKVMH